MTPPKDGKLFRIWVVMLLSIPLGTYPDPAAVFEAGAPI